MKDETKTASNLFDQLAHDPKPFEQVITRPPPKAKVQANPVVKKPSQLSNYFVDEDDSQPQDKQSDSHLAAAFFEAPVPKPATKSVEKPGDITKPKRPQAKPVDSGIAQPFVSI